MPSAVPLSGRSAAEPTASHACTPASRPRCSCCGRSANGANGARWCQQGRVRRLMTGRASRPRGNSTGRGQQAGGRADRHAKILLANPHVPQCSCPAAVVIRGKLADFCSSIHRKIATRSSGVPSAAEQSCEALDRFSKATGKRAA